MATIFTGIADVFKDDMHVSSGTTLNDQLAAAIQDGLALLIAKATEGGRKVPPPYVDPKFREWSDAAQAAGLAFGAYHFERNTDTGTSQAQFVFDTITSIGRDPSQMFVALDHESHPPSPAPPPATANEFATEWLRLAGRYPWIYCDQSRANELAAWNAKNTDIGVLPQCPMWVAGYGIKPWPTCGLGPVLLWQYMGTGSTGNELPNDQGTYPIEFAGLGKVDRSAFQGTRDELLALIQSAGVPG